MDINGRGEAREGAETFSEFCPTPSCDSLLVFDWQLEYCESSLCLCKGRTILSVVLIVPGGAAHL
jgi:hypothetical protein